LETEGTIKDGQSRDIGNTVNKTQKDAQTKQHNTRNWKDEQHRPK